MLLDRAMRRRVCSMNISMAGAAMAHGVASVMVVALACHAPELPSPPLTSQTTGALVEVPFPPPPARVEVIPPRPAQPSVVWIDGEWTWQTRRWVWKQGRWVEPPSNARFAPWITVRDRLGTLYFAEGVWRDRAGAEVPSPPLDAGPTDGSSSGQEDGARMAPRNAP
jgi:hypothetical protein